MSDKVIPQKGKPFNLLQNKKKPQLTIWHKLLFLSPIFAIILIFKVNEWYSEYQLKNNGTDTYATITKISSAGVRDPSEVENVEFSFRYNDSIIFGYTIAKTNSNYALADNGMPLSIGDEFIVKYVIDNPEIYKVNYYKPSKTTIKSYIALTTMSISLLNIFPKSEKQIAQCNCLANKIYEKYGTDGLATIFFNDELVVENIMHNSLAYKNFISKKEITDLIKFCEE
ncbi:MAG: hypothetical protein HY951_07695 [Bacteroidia bacterium]|nr:hypothetical protein [Bacteroidia bacterium]